MSSTTPDKVGQAMTHDEALSWAETMVAPLADRAVETERLRQLPAATMQDALDADIFKMVVPRELGGWGLGLRTLVEVPRILAHGCMSSAWTLSFLMLHNWFIARGSKELQDDIFSARPFALIPCPLAPTGKAVPAEGGYVLTGRWQWATGVQHGDWVMVNAIIERDGAQPETTFCLVPIDDIEIVDVWQTAGMRGTGSNDVVADGLFVPHHRTISGQDLRGDDPPGAQLSPNPFIGYPFTPVLTLVASAPALGGAEAAVDHFRHYIRGRVLPYSPGDRQVEQPASQVRLAEAVATVRAARLVWEDALNRVIETYESGGRLTPAERGRFRLATAHTVRLSLQTVNIIIEGAGASVHFTDSPLGRIHRDLVTLKGHVVYDWDRAAQLAGKLEVGIEPLPTDML
ncbi:MAG: acyl-CoA dehydrogenase family protein [Acidimicrobiales bacterium]